MKWIWILTNLNLPFIYNFSFFFDNSTKEMKRKWIVKKMLCFISFHFSILIEIVCHSIHSILCENNSINWSNCIVYHLKFSTSKHWHGSIEALTCLHLDMMIIQANWWKVYKTRRFLYETKINWRPHMKKIPLGHT